MAVGGKVSGSSVLGGTGADTGEIFASVGILGPVQITGNLQGGSNSTTQSLTTTGYIFGEQITSVSISGSVIAGQNTGKGKLTNSGAIRATYTIGPIAVGNLVGNSTNPVYITARGPEIPTTTDVAITSITVGSFVNKRVVPGNVSYTDILAGYNPAGTGVNAAAQIGPVTVYGNWTSSNLVAGAAPGPDGVFGTADDTKLAGTDALSQVSQIGTIIIYGTVSGISTSHFGFVAQNIASLEIGGKAIKFAAGTPVSLGATTFTTVYELGGTTS